MWERKISLNKSTQEYLVHLEVETEGSKEMKEAYATKRSCFKESGEKEETRSSYILYLI